VGAYGASPDLSSVFYRLVKRKKSREGNVINRCGAITEGTGERVEEEKERAEIFSPNFSAEVAPAQARPGHR